MVDKKLIFKLLALSELAIYIDDNTLQISQKSAVDQSE